MARVSAGPQGLPTEVSQCRTTEVTRLEKLGARREQRVADWYVMRDPAGLPFCVVPAKPGSLDGDNAQRWD